MYNYMDKRKQDAVAQFLQFRVDRDNYIAQRGQDTRGSFPAEDRVWRWIAQRTGVYGLVPMPQ